MGLMDAPTEKTSSFGGMMGAIAPLAGSVIGMLDGRAQDDRQVSQQRKLNALGVASSKELSDYQAQQQVALAEKLGAKWQVEQMKKAGLSVGLMMGKGGPGGTTVGAGVPNVSGGQAANAAQTTQASAVPAQMGLMMAQIANTLADTAKKNAEVPKVNAETGNIIAGTKNTETATDLMGTQKEVMNKQIDEANTRIANIENQTEISKRTKEYQIERIQQESVTALLTNLVMAEQKDAIKSGAEKNRSDIEVNKAKIEQMSQQVMQAWEGLAQGQSNVDINKFQAEIKANYPNVWNIAGKYVNDFVDGVNRLMTKQSDYKKHSVETYK